MTIDESQISAEVYSKKNGIYVVKVSFPDIGFYISSFTVRASTKFAGEQWWVQEPKYQAHGKWRSVLEFDHESPFWLAIKEAAIVAVGIYDNEASLDIDNFDVAKEFNDVFKSDPP